VLVGRITHILDGTSRRFKLNVALIALGTVAFVGLAVFFASSMKPQPAAPKAALSATTATTASRACNADALVTNPAPPVFPDSAKNMVARSASVVAVTVASDGRPLNAKVYQSSGVAAFDQATTAAALASTYTPKTVNCKPVIGSYLFRAEFAPQ
jgi:TonB family protein